MAIQSVRGMHDLFGKEIEKWKYVEEKVKAVLENFGFGEIRTPTMEKIEVFKDTVGEETDIVEKQMYTVQGDEAMVLRPEGTAAFMRAVIQHQLHRGGHAQRYYYYLPMYRHERPQKGRLRQFFQFGGELINDPSPEADAEIIVMLDHLYRALGIHEYEIRLNSLGDDGCRARYREALKAYFRPHLNELDPLSQKRLERAPIRVLDSKDEKTRKLAEGAPLITEFLSDADALHFETLKRCLKSSGVSFTEDPFIVRGLDYYCRTAFEFVSDLLGAQSALVGGGRYDGLSERFGEKSIPSVGFALGMERLLMALEVTEQLPHLERQPFVYFAALGGAALEALFPMNLSLKRRGHSVEMSYDPEKSLKSHLKYANRIHCRYTVIVGEEELGRSVALLKDMSQGTQEEIALDQLLTTLMDRG